MWETTLLGIDLYHIAQWFFIYSFLGWLWETCYVSAKSGRFVNRGFINGPFCTIYGFGALSVYLLLRPLEGHWVLLYIGGVVVATALEYVTAVLMEQIFHTTWWDYSDNKYNFQGRICLGASLGWGVFTVLLFGVLHPFVEWLVSLYPVFAGKIAVCALGLSYIADFTVSAVAAFRLSDKFQAFEKSLDEKREMLLAQLEKYREDSEQKAEEIGGALEQLRSRINETMEEHKETLDEFLQDSKVRRVYEESHLRRTIEDLKKEWADHQNFAVRRHLKAYPHLNRGYMRRQNLKKKKRAKHSASDKRRR